MAADGFAVDDGTMCRYAEHLGATLGCIVDAMAKEARETAFCPIDRCHRRVHSARACSPAAGLPQGSLFRGTRRQGPRLLRVSGQAHQRRGLRDVPRVQGLYPSRRPRRVRRGLPAARGAGPATATSLPRRSAADFSHCRRAWEAAVVCKRPRRARSALAHAQALRASRRSGSTWAPAQRHTRRQLVSRTLVDDFFTWAAEQYARQRHPRPRRRRSWLRREARARRCVDFWKTADCR